MHLSLLNYNHSLFGIWILHVLELPLFLSSFSNLLCILKRVIIIFLLLSRNILSTLDELMKLVKANQKQLAEIALQLEQRPVTAFLPASATTSEELMQFIKITNFVSPFPEFCFCIFLFCLTCSISMQK